MKKLILILSMGVMMSCSKDAETTPIVTPVVVINSDKALDVKIDAIGVDYTDMTPYKIGTLVGSNDQEIGKVYHFNKNNLECTIFYNYEKGISQFSGSNNGHGFTVNLNDSTVNVCGGPQSVQIIYNLKDLPKTSYNDTFYIRKALLLARDLKLETA